MSSVPPAAIQSAGFSSRRRACMEKNVKSGTSFPPIWTFIDCGRDREGRGGGRGRGRGPLWPCQARDTIHFKNDFRALSRPHPPPLSFFGSGVRDCCAERGRSSCNREDKNSTEGRNIRIPGHRSTGIVLGQCKGVNTFRRVKTLQGEFSSPTLVFEKKKRIHTTYIRKILQEIERNRLVSSRLE